MCAQLEDPEAAAAEVMAGILANLELILEQALRPQVLLMGLLPRADQMIDPYVTPPPIYYAQPSK